jgi:hypothetical protein
VRAVRWLRAHPLAAALVACLAIQCAPLLVTRVLPFHDAPGVIGLGGVFAHLDDPRTRVREFFDVDYGLYPSIAYFGWAWLAAQLHIPVDLAFNVFIAAFCLAGPPVALLVTLRAFGRPPALALLALPIGYHHQIWFGFLGSAASVTGLLLALACARRLVDDPRPRWHLGLAGALLFVALCHPFSLGLTLLVVAPVLAWPARERRLRALALRVACFAPTAVVLAAWAGGFFGGGSRDEHPGRVRVLRAPALADAGTFVEWLGGGYRGHADELVVAVALAALAAFLALGVRGRPDEGALARRDRVWLGWAVAALAAGFLLLPDALYWPTYWWGVRFRCVVPLFLVALVCVRRTPRGLPAWMVGIPALAAVLFASYVTADFQGHWKKQALDGFDEALAAIPPGQSLLALPALPDPHYTRGHPYLGQYYVVRTGGRASPYLMGHPGSYWVTMKPAPLAPPWGDPAQFVWSLHAPGYDYFLLERGALDPLATLPRGAVKLISARGQWRLYRRERLPLPGE